MDFYDKNFLKKMDAVREAFLIETANGVTSCDTKLKVKFPDLDEKALVCHVLDQTPPVVSVGWLCSERMYAFYWLSGSRIPYFLTPKGKLLPLDVEDYIPYLVFGNTGQQNTSFPGIKGDPRTPAKDYHCLLYTSPSPRD